MAESKVQTNTIRICEIGGCNKTHFGRGWCLRHYSRWRINGHPLKTAPKPSPIQRFWTHVDKTESCWLWTGGRTRSNYGTFWADGITLY